MMKIKIEYYGREFTVDTLPNGKEKQIDETSLEDIFNIFKGMLISCGWASSSVDETILELAECIHAVNKIEDY